MGSCLSERQGGTVREDYSDDGDAWNYFSHDQVRSRAYRRAEDGLGGICDDHQVLCFALALWNGRDPILKAILCRLSSLRGGFGRPMKNFIVLRNGGKAAYPSTSPRTGSARTAQESVRPE